MSDIHPRDGPCGHDHGVIEDMMALTVSLAKAFDPFVRMGSVFRAGKMHYPRMTVVHQILDRFLHRLHVVDAYHVA